MSSTDSPPSYSDPAAFFNEKCPKSTAYHLTLERCKQSIKLESGRYASSGFLDDLDVAITIPSHHTWPEVRKQVWSRFQSAWPAILGKAELRDFAVGITMQYLTEDGKVRGCVQLLDNDEEALWDLCKRENINVVRFYAHCSPRKGVAAGAIKKRGDPWFEELPREDTGTGSRKKSARKGEGKVKRRCVLQ